MADFPSIESLWLNANKKTGISNKLNGIRKWVIIFFKSFVKIMLLFRFNCSLILLMKSHCIENCTIGLKINVNISKTLHNNDIMPKKLWQ